MLSKFAANGNGAFSSNSTGMSNTSAPSTPKVQSSAIKSETHRHSAASESYEAKQTKQGGRYNNLGNGICCNCAGQSDAENNSSVAQTKSELANSPAVSSKSFSPCASGVWETLPPNPGPNKSVSFSGSSAGLPTPSVSSSFPDTSRSPPTPDTGDSRSTGSKEDCENYAPYTFHEMSKLADANMSLSSSSPSEGETRDETGRTTYADVLRRTSPPHLTITPAAPNDSHNRHKRSSVEKWMKEKNTPDHLNKLSNL